MAYETATRKRGNYDLGGWHDGPDCVIGFVPGFTGIGVKIYCLTCRVLSDVQAVGVGISPASARKARTS